MNIFGQLGGLLSQFTSGQGNVEEHFDNVSQAVPQSSLAQGLAAAFHSDQTPPFAQMAAQMFGNANGGQQASVLNSLLASAGPGVLSQILGSGKLPNLGALLGGGGGGGVGGGDAAAAAAPAPAEITPEQAQQVPAEEVQELAHHLEKHDPSVVERLSEVYSAHPALIKTLGSVALTIALAKIAEKHG